MRLSSAPVRFSSLLLLLLFVSCAKSPPADTVDELLVLEGEVTVAGSHPFDKRIVLVDEVGVFWMLQCGKHEAEIMNLSGHRIRVSGSPPAETLPDPVLIVDSYEMLPVGGMKPVTGILVLKGDALILEQGATGTRFTIAGGLREALKQFVGMKIWVVGVERPGGEEGGIAINVTGYGILAPAD
jgi:hypothetical protein